MHTQTRTHTSRVRVAWRSNLAMSCVEVFIRVLKKMTRSADTTYKGLGFSSGFRR
jgi:hypothetical protein